MSVSPAFVIMLGNITAPQRNAAHELIKKDANGWWHHLPDVWIVGGHGHKHWADLLAPIINGTPGKLVVLELPRDHAERMFAQRNGGQWVKAEESSRWLWETYYGRPKPS